MIRRRLAGLFACVVLAGTVACATMDCRCHLGNPTAVECVF